MRMETHTLEVVSYITSEYNEELSQYLESRNIEIYLSYFNRTTYAANNTELVNCTYVGLTKDRLIKKGDRIDGKYIVEFILAADRDYICYLKEVGNNGRVE